MTLGEIEAFALDTRWGDARRKKLSELRTRLVAVDISDARVTQSYARLSTLAKEHGWAIFHDKNDLWIAAATEVSGATLLSTDGAAFIPLRDGKHLDVIVLDAKTGWRLP